MIATEGTEMSRFDFGGTLALATSMLASGVGVVDESIAPYEDADGKHLSDGDWSLPEELRFVQSFARPQGYPSVATATM